MFSAQQRVLSQKFWPYAGDVDDCWVLATLMAIAAVAPWLWLVNVKQFRAAAGIPDLPGPTPGGVSQAYKAVRALYPQLAVTLVTNGTWSAMSAMFKANRPAYLSVNSGALPAALQFGFTGDHAVLVFFRNGAFFLANPLGAPHSSAQPITEAALQKAALAHAGGLQALFMPTVEAAFATHPLLAPAIKAAVDKALAAVPSPAPVPPTAIPLPTPTKLAPGLYQVGG